MALRLPMSLSPLSNITNLIDNAFYDIPFVSNPTKTTSNKVAPAAVLGTSTRRATTPTTQTNIQEQQNPTPNDDFVGSGNVLSESDVASQKAAQAEAKRQAEVGSLRGEISGRGGEYESLINELFGQLDGLLKERSAGVEKEYGEQFTKAADTYTAAIPQISNSYAAIGSGDSTDKSDAKDGAKKGFDDTNKTIKKNKESDEAKIGQYGNEQRAKFEVDRDNVKRNVERAGTTDDVDALRGMRNDLEGGLGNAKVTKATLGTDGQARKDLQGMTADNGRFGEAQNALDGIIKSSMSGAVKEAAVKSIVDNAGLSEEDKQKVALQYGNVYNEQNLA